MQHRRGTHRDHVLDETTTPKGIDDCMTQYLCEGLPDNANDLLNRHNFSCDWFPHISFVIIVLANVAHLMQMLILRHAAAQISLC